MITRPIDEIKDAYDFRETLIPKAECSLGAAPLWHGWALAECYWAGMEREREKLKAEVARLERENQTLRINEEMRVHEEGMADATIIDLKAEVERLEGENEKLKKQVEFWQGY